MDSDIDLIEKEYNIKTKNAIRLKNFGLLQVLYFYVLSLELY